MSGNKGESNSGTDVFSDIPGQVKVYGEEKDSSNSDEIIEEEVVDDLNDEGHERSMEEEFVEDYSYEEEAGNGSSGLKKFLIAACLVVFAGAATFGAMFYLEGSSPAPVAVQQSPVKQLPQIEVATQGAAVKVAGSQVSVSTSNVDVGVSAQPAQSEVGYDYMAGLSGTQSQGQAVDPLAGLVGQAVQIQVTESTAINDTQNTAVVVVGNDASASEQSEPVLVKIQAAGNAPIAAPGSAPENGRIQNLEQKMASIEQVIQQLLAQQTAKTHEVSAMIDQKVEEVRLSPDSSQGVDLIANNQEIETLKAVEVDLKKQVKSLKGQIAKLKKAKQGLSGKVAKLAAKVKDLTKDNAWLAKLLDAKELIIAKLTTEIELYAQRPLLPGWDVVGMTDNSVVFRDKDARYLTLHQGTSFAGVTITSIDVASGKVETDQGTIHYARQKQQG